MAMKLLKKCWMNSNADRRDRIRLDDVTGFSDEREIPGREVLTASGSTRSVQGVGMTRQLPLAISAATVDVQRWVTDHMGEIVWLRTPYGQLLPGVYRGLKIDPVIDAPGLLANIELTFKPLTIPVAVA